MDDLELQRLEDVAIAAQAMCEAADVTAAYGAEGDRSDYIVEMDVSAQAWEALADALNVLDKEKEVPKTEYTEYDDGPWATGGSDSNVDVAGHWQFPRPDVSSKVEVKTPIMIVPLKDGYVVEDGEFKVARVALTNAEDLAEWLLGWLGFKESDYYLMPAREGLAEELADSVEAKIEAYAAEMENKWPNIDAQLADYYKRLDGIKRRWANHDERLYEIEQDHEKALGVARAAQTYVETGDERDFIKLVEAVKKWRGIEEG